MWKIGMDVNEENGVYGETCLMMAVLNDSVDFVKMLLDAGANVHKSRKDSGLIFVPCLWS